MKKSYSSWLVFGTAALTTLSGCSALKNMDDMKNTTATLSQTSSGMAKTILETNQGIKESNAYQASVEERIKFAAYATSQGATADLRVKFLNSMKAEPTIAGKLKYAAMYMYGFEFQVWTPGIASVEYRQALFLKAVEEMIETIESLRKAADNANATSLSDRRNDLYALSATLHKFNIIQDEYNVLPGQEKFPEYSMLNVITDGLRKMADVKQNKVSLESLPLYQQRVQQYSNDFIYLLQVRYNFMGAFAWTHLKDGAPMSTLNELSRLLVHGVLPEIIPPESLEPRASNSIKKPNIFNKIVGELKCLIAKIESWEPHWDKIPDARIDRAGEIIEYAVATKKILDNLGQAIPEDNLIRNQYVTLTWSPSQEPETRLKNGDCNGWAARLRLKNAIAQYLLEKPAPTPDSEDEQPVDPIAALPDPSVIHGWTGGSTDPQVDQCTGTLIPAAKTLSSSIEE